MRFISLNSAKTLWDNTAFSSTSTTQRDSLCKHLTAITSPHQYSQHQYSQQEYSQHKHTYQHQQGFTLTELLITIAIAGIVLALAMPSLNNFMVKMRVDNHVSQLNRLVLTARNTAINTEQNVTLCPINTNNTCSNDWQNELSVFIDLDNDGVYEPALPAIPPVPTESIVQVKSAATAGDTITYAGQNRVSFLPTGALSSIPSTFIYCPASDATLARAIVLSLSGRAYMSADLNGDGRDQDRDQSNISCN